MDNLNNRCKSIKVSYVKSPNMVDNVVLNEYYNQKVIIDLTKEQLDTYNKHVRGYEKENFNGVNTHSTLKEGENAFDSSALLQVYCYFWTTNDERFKTNRNTIVQVNLV